MEIKEFSEELRKLGQRLKQLRKHRGLKLLDLEVLSGINDSDISRYERGKENIEFLTIFKLARALEVEINVIIEYDGPFPDNSQFKGFGKIHSINSNKKKKSSK